MSDEQKFTPEQLQQQVDMVCNELLAMNEKISVRILIDRLDGKITSTSTASKYLSDWRARKEAQAKELFETSGFSSELTNAFVAEIRRHAAQAENRAQANVLALTEQLSEVTGELQKQERLHGEYKALSGQREKQILELEQEIETNRLLHKQAIESNSKEFEHELEKLNATTKVRLDDVNQALQSEREKAESYEGIIECLRRDLAKASLKLETLDELKSSNSALNSLNKDLESQVSDLNVRLATAVAEVEGRDKIIALLEAQRVQ